MKKIEPDLLEALPIGNYLGESPSWSVEEQSLYWINCEQPAELLRWLPSTGALDRWPMPRRIGGYAMASDGSFVVVLADGVYSFDRESNKLSLLIASPLPPHIALHEAGVDRSGHLWVGSINHEITADRLTPGGGKLFRLEEGQLREIDSDISCSNGLAFSNDGRRVYHCDTSAAVVSIFPIDENGVVGRREFFLKVPYDEGMVDGATIDAEGGYWAAMFIAGTVRRYLPDGSLDLEFNLPFSGPTKVAFGGSELRDLYITTAQLNVPSLIESPTSGHVYSFEPGFQGVAETMLDPETLRPAL